MKFHINLIERYRPFYQEPWQKTEFKYKINNKLNEITKTDISGPPKLIYFL